MKSRDKTKNRNELVKQKIKLEEPKIEPHSRVLFVGKTGSGKTTAAKEFLKPVKRLLIIDSKNGLDNWEHESDNVLTRAKFRNGKDTRIRVTEDKAALELLQIAYDTGDCTVYIDEINAIIPPGTRPPQVFVNIWQRGRSKKIAGWASTQRPASIPLIFLSEAEYFFIFRLNLLDDRKRVAQFGGEQVLEPVRDKYGFYYYSINNDEPIYYKRIII